MANYYGYGRSNYVEVTDEQQFKDLCNQLGLEVIEKDFEGVKKYGCHAYNNEDGEPEQYTFSEEEDEKQLPDLGKSVSKLLKDGEVFIWQHVGNEKIRYLGGYSYAINSKGKEVHVNIDDIYKKASKLGTGITRAEY